MYRCKDALGRIWEVSVEAVHQDIMQYYVDDDGMTEEEALRKTTEDQSWKDYWFVEQILPHPDYVMKIGTMVEDVSDERKQEVLEWYAERSMDIL